MMLPPQDRQVLDARWTNGALLKRDIFSTVERGRLKSDAGEVDAVLRRLDEVPFWSRPLAKLLFRREKRALRAATSLGVGPPLLWAGKDALVRGWIDGYAMHLAKPKGDVGYFRSARKALNRLHRACITHNDLAKQQNWLRGTDGQAYLTDFQLASCFKRRTKMFRIAAYEDLRHLLKHKRWYAPESLTVSERRILARKAAVSLIWFYTGKQVYKAVARGVFNYTDREGGGPRLVNDAPVIVDALRKVPEVKDAAVVAFADRRAGVGLYAFVEPNAAYSGSKSELEDLTAGIFGRKWRGPVPPEHIQAVDALPRDASGDVRNELLHLIAMNQVDLVEPLIANSDDRDGVMRIVDQRKNLRDRHRLQNRTSYFGFLKR
jgi:hypothetical protein